jgi:hypothetical protein
VTGRISISRGQLSALSPHSPFIIEEEG